MPDIFSSTQRYFLSLKYNGAGYAGFQVQENAQTIQGEVEKALNIYTKKKIVLTGSSRTDAGVHAQCNFFHFDFDGELTDKHLYHLNAILPAAISLERIWKVHPTAHCRFDAIGREYAYHIYAQKDPFLDGRAWFYPYPMDLDALNEAARSILGKHDFTSFAKKKSQVKTHMCEISHCLWKKEGGHLIFEVKGNRFLRGMVRGLVGTMVKVGRGKMSIYEFENVLLSKDNTMADFAAPACGLYLQNVTYGGLLKANS